ncbi:MAG: Rsd/AlgQ family anti-sigma factor [Moraxellaceae bacterium]|nr:Rsd/AlgQ family anti-sigma factor [Moraxellaceae bacterium]HQV41811.1 Rsd/AlgQ family anti-sigma factor [Moraxellaceae bacterium]
MLNPSAGPEDHHHRVEMLVRRWLDERQSLIVQMLGLGEDARSPSESAPVIERVQAFCEVLMDYVSAGYFEVYDELLAEGEAQGRKILAEGQALLQKLQSSLDAIIHFNDLHDDPEDSDVLGGLPHELSQLGLTLEERFQIEDRMIALLHAPAPVVPA